MSGFQNFDSAYLDSPPMVPADTFRTFHKLARDDPDRAVRNVESVGFCALGKPDDNFVDHPLNRKRLLTRLNPRSLPP